MTMNRAQFKKELLPGLNALWGLEEKRYVDEWKQIFEVNTSRKAYEEDVLLTGFGAAQIKREGGGIAYDEGGEAWTARYYHIETALAFAITEIAIEDNLYGDIAAKYVKALVRSMNHTDEIMGIGIINRGWDSNYPIGDGQPLFSTSHPLSGGGTFSNTFATQADLTEASMEDALNQIGLFVDDRGIPEALNGVKLHVPIGLRMQAERLTMSQLRTNTADNDVNALRSMSLLTGGYAVNHRISDPNSWFIQTDAQDGFKYFERRKLRKRLEEGDFETGNFRYKVDKRGSFGVTNPRAAFGSQGGS